MATPRYLCGILNPLFKSRLSKYANEKLFDLRVFSFSLQVACFYVSFLKLRFIDLLHCTKGYQYPTGLPSYRVQIAETKRYAHSVPICQLVYKIVGGYSNHTGQKRAMEYWRECPCSWSSMTLRYNIRIQFQPKRLS